MNINKKELALAIVRVTVAGNMLIHGITRCVVGGVTPFDGYLGSLGFPPYTAWAITVFEIIAAVLIIAKRWTSVLAIIFCIELVTGILLVHGPEGWFVVGHGRNGMEYSVLLILCFVGIALAYWPKRKSL